MLLLQQYINTEKLLFYKLGHTIIRLACSQEEVLWRLSVQTVGTWTLWGPTTDTSCSLLWWTPYISYFKIDAIRCLIFSLNTWYLLTGFSERKIWFWNGANGGWVQKGYPYCTDNFSYSFADQLYKYKRCAYYFDLEFW